MLAVPSDLLGEEITNPSSADASPPPAPAPGEKELRDVVRLLSAARRPVVIAGGGTLDAREALISFSEAWGAGIYAAFRRQDVFPNEHPNYLGHLTLGAPPPTLEALQRADLVLVVGCRLSEITTQGYEVPRAEQAVIQIDADPAVVGAVVPLKRGVVADARTALDALVARAPSSRPSRGWAEAHGAYLNSSTIPPDRASTGVDPARVVAVLRELLPEGAILANDAGNFSVFLHRYWRYNHPRTQLGPTSGAMGYGVPAAIAAKLAAPERPVVALCGDGGFLMTGQEMETAVRYGAAITVVVFRNGMHGTIAMHQARALGRTAGTEIGEVDLAGYARSLGARGYTVRDRDDLAPALEEALFAEAPALVDVVTDPDLINPTARLSELAGGQA
jgi:acetolactate synthase-1/2/3 large subunit